MGDVGHPVGDVGHPVADVGHPLGDVGHPVGEVGRWLIYPVCKWLTFPSMSFCSTSDNCHDLLKF